MTCTIRYTTKNETGNDKPDLIIMPHGNENEATITIYGRERDLHGYAIAQAITQMPKKIRLNSKRKTWTAFMLQYVREYAKEMKLDLHVYEDGADGREVNEKNFNEEEYCGVLMVYQGDFNSGKQLFGYYV